MKVLFIGAHFDDIEIGCGGTAAKFVSQGYKVSALIVTDSGYADEDGREVRNSEVARIEGIAGLNMLGIRDIHEMSWRTGLVSYGRELIHDLERIMKRIEPDLVFTHWTNDVHQDHSAIGRATLNVCRKTGSLLMYRSNWYRGNVDFSPKIFVNTSEFFEVKKEAINCHVSEVSKFGSKWLSFIEAQDAAVGMEFGHLYAESFEPVKLNFDLIKRHNI